MAIVQLLIKNQNDVVGPILMQDVSGGTEVNGGGSIMLPPMPGGITPTLVVEGSPGSDPNALVTVPGQPSIQADVWIQLALTVPTAGVEAAAASITGGAGPVYGRFEIVGLKKVRARQTSANAAQSYQVTLTTKAN